MKLTKKELKFIIENFLLEQEEDEEAFEDEEPAEDEEPPVEDEEGGDEDEEAPPEKPEEDIADTAEKNLQDEDPIVAVSAFRGALKLGQKIKIPGSVKRALGTKLNPAKNKILKKDDSEYDEEKFEKTFSSVLRSLAIKT